MRVKINTKIVPICVYYFFLCFGNSILWPYFSLQMRGLGLTLNDVALIAGLAPVFAFIATPLFGYIGDKVGYKIILILTLLLIIGTSAALNFLPQYREYPPKIAFNREVLDLNTSSAFLASDIAWLGYIGQTGGFCEKDVSKFTIDNVICEEKTYNVNISLQENTDLHLIEEDCPTMESTICRYTVGKLQLNNSLIICEAVFEDFNGIFEEGSHSLTFWTYFLVRTALMIAMNACYNISDAAAATVAKREGSSFSTVFFFGGIGNLLPPLFIGIILDKINLSSAKFDCISGMEIFTQDFKFPYSISNGILFILSVFTFCCLDVQMEKPDKKLSFKEEFFWLANPAAFAFYLFMFEFGFSQGAGDNFFFVYAQEELGASATLLGYIQEANQISAILMVLLANYLIKKLGPVNLACLSIFFLCGELVLVGLTTSTPPWEFIGYHALAGVFPLLWCSVIAYCSRIAPATLTATAISLCATLVWIAGKGVGTLLAGFLIDKFSLSTMFLIIGGNGMVSSILYWAAYHTYLKKKEVTKDSNKEQGVVNTEYQEEIFTEIRSYNTRL